MALQVQFRDLLGTVSHIQHSNMVKIIILVKDISLNENGTFNLEVKIVVNDGITQFDHLFKEIEFISSQSELEEVMGNLAKEKLEKDLGFQLKNEDIVILY